MRGYGYVRTCIGVVTLLGGVKARCWHMVSLWQVGKSVFGKNKEV